MNAHAQPITINTPLQLDLRPAVFGFIWREDKIYVGNPVKDRSLFGQWVSGGGKSEYYETTMNDDKHPVHKFAGFRKALWREMWEETNSEIAFRSEIPFAIINHVGYRGPIQAHFFDLELAPGTARPSDTDEVRDWQLKSLKSLYNDVRTSPLVKQAAYIKLQS